MEAPSTAYLLGAGFSVEMGMPTSRELTQELVRWLKPRLLEMYAARLAQSEPAPVSAEDVRGVVSAFRLVLADESLNYEEMLGTLHTRSRDFKLPDGQRRLSHGLYRFLLEMVGAMLYYRVVFNLEFIKKSVPFYRGFRTLADRSRPIWVFSLNHDTCLEMLAGELLRECRRGLPKPQRRLSRPLLAGGRTRSRRRSTATTRGAISRALPDATDSEGKWHE